MALLILENKVALQTWQWAQWAIWPKDAQQPIHVDRGREGLPVCWISVGVSAASYSSPACSSGEPTLYAVAASATGETETARLQS